MNAATIISAGLGLPAIGSLWVYVVRSMGKRIKYLEQAERQCQTDLAELREAYTNLYKQVNG